MNVNGQVELPLHYPTAKHNTARSGLYLRDMEWIQSTPGNWYRRMDCIESYFHTASSVTTLGGIVHMMVTVGAKLPGGMDLPIENFRAAWRSLRYHHPRIACSITDGKIHYSVPHEDEVSAWLATSILVDTSGHSALEVVGTLKSVKTGVLVLLPHRQEVFIQIPHDHIDGIGAIMLLRLLLNEVDCPTEVQFGNEHRNLSDSVTHILKLDGPRTSDAEIAQKLVSKFAEHLPTLSLPCNTASKPRDAVCMERVVLSHSATSEVCRQAKSHDITVTHACHSAMIQALRNQAVEKEATYASLFFFNLRNQLANRSGLSSSPVSVHVSAFPGVVEADRGDDFFQIAKRLKKIYTERAPDMAHTAMHELLYAGLASTLRASTHGRIFLSSLGVVDEHLDHEVADIWIGAGSATADMTVYLWTYRGQLTIAAWYNSAFYEKRVVDCFLREMQAHLTLALGGCSIQTQ